MIEFILVVAISGIVIIGLAAVVEVPRQMIEREQEGGSHISSCDRAVARLDEEVRFAKDVAVPDSNTLDISTATGETIRYRWDGVEGGDLVRTAPDGTGTVLGSIRHLAFRLNMTEHVVPATEDKPLVMTPVETASFTEFTLKPGYEIDATVVEVESKTATEVEAVASTLTKVTETRSYLTINKTDRAGIFFTPTSITDDAASATMVRLRLRRNGVDDLAVVIYELDEKTNEPIRSELVAYAKVANAAIPVSLSDMSIPLSCLRKMSHLKKYFVEVMSSGSGNAADIEYKTLSDPDAVATANGGFVVSDSSGASFYSPSTRTEACQSDYSMMAVKSEPVIPGTTETEVVEMIPTSVQLDVQLTASSGDAILNVSFPVENNLALVNQ